MTVISWTGVPMDGNAVTTALEWKNEVDRLLKLFEDAGQGEHNVLALIDHYQRNLMDADGRLREVRALLEENGCECECGHPWEDHDDDCDRCLACRIAKAVQQ